MLRQPYDLKHLSDPLAASVRHFMIEELFWSCRHNRIYASKYLTHAGLEGYPQLLEQALLSGSPDSLCDSLGGPGIWQAAAPRHSIDTFAWDEFNKYYMRALCRGAREHPQYEILVVRGRHSGSHRSSSDGRIHQTRDPEALLQELRIRPAINPFGANSGLTLTLHEIGTDSRQGAGQ
jgi:hypothetical protein